MNAYSTAWDAPAQPGIVLDGCAGPGGWSEGIRRHLGLHDVGLEWDEAACKTRAAAGHLTIRVDVSAFVLTPLLGRVWGLLFSPPCTLFSEAGTQIGRLMLDILADGIRRLMRGEDCRAEMRERVYTVALAAQEKRNAKRASDKRWGGERVEAQAREDAFIACLVLEPARYLHALITALDPQVSLEWAALEQVPSVLPLWQVYAEELRRLGWSVWAGILNAADYGVGQSRRRAVLIASAVRRVHAPDTTHAENGGGEDLFGGFLAPWRTMAETIGWGATDRPAPTVTAGGTKAGGAEPFPTNARKILTDAQERGAWVLHTNRDQRPDGTRQTVNPYTRPAPTLTSKSGGQWQLRKAGAPVADSIRINVAEAGLLQSFPEDYPWQGGKNKGHEQAGNAVPPLLAAHIVSAATGLAMPAADPALDAAA
ncbi:DNA cytosine methyltransferase [Streptomyces sp. NPDC007875]|uniref:DNA cytosine methyltransferase n=1 Tax=Streptomyces sp. NPDC007875 TaxID=3364783 RepID=UPI0036C5C797